MDAVLLGVVKNQGFSAHRIILLDIALCANLDGSLTLMDAAFLNAAAIISSAILLTLYLLNGASAVNSDTRLQVPIVVLQNAAKSPKPPA